MKEGGMKSLFILKLESFEGSDTFVRCGDDDQDFLYCIVATDNRGNAEIIDSGYRSFEEAALAWPDASNPNTVSKPIK